MPVPHLKFTADRIEAHLPDYEAGKSLREILGHQLGRSGHSMHCLVSFTTMCSGDQYYALTVVARTLPIVCIRKLHAHLMILRAPQEALEQTCKTSDHGRNGLNIRELTPAIWKASRATAGSWVVAIVSYRG